MKKLLSFILLSVLCCLDMQATVMYCKEYITKSVTYEYTDGSIVIDYDKKKITLNHLKEYYKKANILYFDQEESPWTIIVNGECQFITDNQDALITHDPILVQSCKSVTFVGAHTDMSDKLTVISKHDSNIYQANSTAIAVTSSSNVFFKNMQLDVTNLTGCTVGGFGSKVYFKSVVGTFTSYPDKPCFDETAGTKGNDIILGEELVVKSPEGVKWDAVNKKFYTEPYGMPRSVRGKIVIDFDDFDLKVAGKPVTGRNMWDVLGDGKRKMECYRNGDGLITLWLYDGLELNTENERTIEWGSSHTGEHRIVVMGTVTLNSNEDVIFNRSEGTLIIYGNNADGSATLNMHSVRGDCIFTWNGDVWISKINLNTTSDKLKCINSLGKGQLTLANLNATLSASGTGLSAIGNFASVVEDNCYTTDYSYYNTEKKGYVDETGTTVMKKLQFKRGTAYPLEVRGTRVTKDNAKDILGNGKVSFSVDDDYDCLEFKNAYINYPDNLIYISSTCKKGIVIVFTGNNSLATSSTKLTGHAIYNRSSVVPLICGNGDHSLTIYAAGPYNRAIWTESDLYMKNLNATIYNASNSNPALYSNSGGSVFFENCELTVENKGATSKGVLDGFTGATTDLCYLDDCFYYPNKGIVNMKDELLSKIQVKRGYGLEVAGVTVTDANRNDVLGDGTVSYKHPCLTLNNFHCTGEFYGIKSQNRIEIELKGDNRIDDTYYGIHNTSNMCDADVPATTIKGTGSLTIEAYDTGIYARSGGLKIKDCVLNVIGIDDWGIRGFRGLPYETLKIDKAYINVKGTQGALGWFKSISASDQLLNPGNASIGTYAGCAAVVYSTNNRVRSNVPVIFGNFDFNDDDDINIVDIPHLIKKMKTVPSYKYLLKPLKNKILDE